MMKMMIKVFCCHPSKCTLTWSSVLYLNADTYDVFYLNSYDSIVHQSNLSVEEIGQHQDSQSPIQLVASTEIADMRGPYIPLFGVAVVLFPAQ